MLPTKWVSGEGDAWGSFAILGPEDLIRAMMEKPKPEPRRVRTLDDMSDGEIAKLERQYGCKVRRGGRSDSSQI